MAINMDLDVSACLESRELVGLLEDNKQPTSKGLTAMFMTYEHLSDSRTIEFDQMIDESHFGLTPAVAKCFLPPDITESGFITKEFRPGSYADGFQINNCDRCPPRVPLEREYSMLGADEKLMMWRAYGLNVMRARRDNRYEHDIAQIIMNSGFWIRYQDERGNETDRFYVMYPRDARLSGAAVGTPWSDPNSNIKCDIQEFIDVHSDISCRPVYKVFFGANVMKHVRAHQHFDIVPQYGKLSDLRFAPNFTGSSDMMEPCNHMFEGMRDIGSFCEIDYYTYNARYKANGGLHHFLDPDCVYTVALNPGQDAIGKLSSKFTTLRDGPVENDVWHREFYEARPDTMELDDRFCTMPGLMYENVFAKWRVL